MVPRSWFLALGAQNQNERHWETPTGLAGAEQRPTQEEETPMGTRDLLVGQIGQRWSGRAMARTGLRMMPTFPSPSLKVGSRTGAKLRRLPLAVSAVSSFVPV